MALSTARSPLSISCSRCSSFSCGWPNCGPQCDRSTPAISPTLHRRGAQGSSAKHHKTPQSLLHRPRGAVHRGEILKTPDKNRDDFRACTLAKDMPQVDRLELDGVLGSVGVLIAEELARELCRYLPQADPDPSRPFPTASQNPCGLRQTDG